VTLEESKALMRTMPQQTIHMIAHMVDANLPGGSMSMHGVSAVRSAEPNLGCVIVVSNSIFVAKLLEISGKINPIVAQRYRTAHSLAEAKAIIANYPPASNRP
jgi:hypothetical protein